MKYNDYPDKYPNQIIEKLNLAYENKFIKDDKQDIKDDFFNISSLSMVDKSVTIASESRCQLEGMLVNLLESLKRCEELLVKIKHFDKTNKNLAEYIEKTKNNKIEIANCCYNKYDIQCDYYATYTPSFNACCSNYCSCELDVIEQLLCLCNCKGFPLNRNILFNLIFCRLNCLKGIIEKYSLK